VPVEQGWRVSQVSLNDGTVEGLEHVSLPFFSIQYHPEGSPGPLDSQDVFDRFLDRVRAAGSRREAPVTTGTRIGGVQE